MEREQNTLFDNRYLLKVLKGSGSFGEVWLAEDQTLEIEVAVKIYSALDAKGIDEFKEEFKTTFELRHVNLLHAFHFDVAQEGGEKRPYLVMPYCPNGSAFAFVGNISEEMVWKFIRDVTAGLAYLHEQEPPIVHQDIKPENVLIDKDFNFVITDFGISKRIRSTLRRNSSRTTSAGTTAYMGPERFTSDPVPIKASDIWSLGATLYELIMGELPFCGIGGGMQKSGAEIPVLSDAYSHELNKLMRACLAENTWDRPTASFLHQYASEALEAWGEGRSLPIWNGEDKEEMHRKPSTYRSADGRNSQPLHVNTPGEKSNIVPPKKRSSKVVLITLIILLLVAAGVGGGFYYKTQLPSDAEINQPRYNEFVNLFDKQIGTEIRMGYVDPLLEAQVTLDSIVSMEEKYSIEAPGIYNQSAARTSKLNSEKERIIKSWIPAAEAQYAAGNRDMALQLCEDVLKLKEDAAVRSMYNEIRR